MSEPLRTRLYPVVVAIAAILVGYGVLDDQTAALWIALAAAVLGAVGIETARTKVTPVEDLGDGTYVAPSPVVVAEDDFPDERIDDVTVEPGDEVGH